MVPADRRPLNCYVSESLPETESLRVAESGWKLVDVRLMPNKTDEDRRACVKAWLEGIRSGTIEVEIKRLKFIELEAKVLGMIGGKAPTSDLPDRTDFNELLA